MAIQIPSNLAASSSDVAADQLSNLTPFLLIIIGVLLSALLIEIIIHAIRPK